MPPKKKQRIEQPKKKSALPDENLSWVHSSNVVKKNEVSVAKKERVAAALANVAMNTPYQKAKHRKESKNLFHLCQTQRDKLFEEYENEFISMISMEDSCRQVLNQFTNLFEGEKVQRENIAEGEESERIIKLQCYHHLPRQQDNARRTISNDVLAIWNHLQEAELHQRKLAWCTQEERKNRVILHQSEFALRSDLVTQHQGKVTAYRSTKKAVQELKAMCSILTSEILCNEEIEHHFLLGIFQRTAIGYEVIAKLRSDILRNEDSLRFELEIHQTREYISLMGSMEQERSALKEQEKQHRQRFRFLYDSFCQIRKEILSTEISERCLIQSKKELDVAATFQFEYRLRELVSGFILQAREEKQGIFYEARSTTVRLKHDLEEQLEKMQLAIKHQKVHLLGIQGEEQAHRSNYEREQELGLFNMSLDFERSKLQLLKEHQELVADIALLQDKEVLLRNEVQYCFDTEWGKIQSFGIRQKRVLEDVIKRKSVKQKKLDENMQFGREAILYQWEQGIGEMYNSLIAEEESINKSLRLRMLQKDEFELNEYCSRQQVIVEEEYQWSALMMEGINHAIYETNVAAINSFASVEKADRNFIERERWEWYSIAHEQVSYTILTLLSSESDDLTLLETDARAILEAAYEEKFGEICSLLSVGEEDLAQKLLPEKKFDFESELNRQFSELSKDLETFSTADVIKQSRPSNNNQNQYLSTVLKISPTDLSEMQPRAIELCVQLLERNISQSRDYRKSLEEHYIKLRNEEQNLTQKQKDLARAQQELSFFKAASQKAISQRITAFKTAKSHRMAKDHELSRAKIRSIEAEKEVARAAKKLEIVKEAAREQMRRGG